MRPWFGRHATAIAAICFAGAAAAQPPAAPSVDAGASAGEEDNPEIVVKGARPIGSVIGDIEPEVTLTPADIRSYGVSSISDLLTELAPQTGSVQGRGGESPIVLLAGRRISSFAEIRDIPTEAIQRVEILPEEVALKYGYRPEQKVVNIVLRRRFHAITGEGKASAATEGGRASEDGKADFLRIRSGHRINASLDYQHASPLYESERGIVPAQPTQPYDSIGNIASASGGALDPTLGGASVLGLPASAAMHAPTLADFATPDAVRTTDTSPYRTLLGGSNGVTANAVYARPIGKVSASFNGTFAYTDTDSALGLARARLAIPAGSPFSPFAGDTVLYRYLDELGPLRQAERDLSGHFGTTLSGDIKSWNWTVTGTYDRASSRTLTDAGADLSALQSAIAAGDPTVNPYAPIDPAIGRLTNLARSLSSTGDVQGTITGTPFKLPAGGVTATLKLGGTFSDFSSHSLRAGTEQSASIGRDEGSGQLSLDLPIASRKHGVLPVLGELSANLNAGFDRMSDFGTLVTAGAGLTWAPVKPVSLIASYNREQGAPTVQQLGNPAITTSGVRVFDYVTGQTAEITRLAGGNPDLVADKRQVWKAGFTLKPNVGKAELSITGTYVYSRTDHPIETFPTATAAIEAAFPDRFTRDADGRLTAIDARPVNFDREDKQDVRWGINFSKQLWAPPRPERPAGADLRAMLPPGGNRGDGARQGPGGGGGRGFGGFGGGGARGTRLQLAVYYTWHIEDRLAISADAPRLDLLNGDALTNTGGTPRHEVQAQAGLTHNAFGVRASLNWRAPTTVNSGPDGTEPLDFSSLTTVGLRLFANLGALPDVARKHPFLRGTRITLDVTNLFDQRIRVRDPQGNTPISYQPAYLDAIGRTIGFTLRKLFF